MTDYKRLWGKRRKKKTRRKPIRINPKMRGVFTKKAKKKGMSVQKYAKYIVKKYKGKKKTKRQLKLFRQALFAKTARKWKKKKRRKRTRKKRGGDGDDDKKKRKIEESSGSSGSSQSTSRPTSRRRRDDTLEKCSLCLENLEIPAASFCTKGHGFHKHCLNRILVMITENGLNPVCHICRGEPNEKVRRKIQEMQHAEEVRQSDNEPSDNESFENEYLIPTFQCNFCERSVPENDLGNPPDNWRRMNQDNLMCDTCQTQRYFTCGHTHRVHRFPGNFFVDEFDCGEHVTRDYYELLPPRWSTVNDDDERRRYRCPRHTSGQSLITDHFQQQQDSDEEQQDSDEEHEEYRNTMQAIANNTTPYDT